MPSRMQQALENEKQSGKSTAQPEEFSFKPFINEAKTGAQFKKMQDNF